MLKTDLAPLQERNCCLQAKTDSHILGGNLPGRGRGVCLPPKSAHPIGLSQQELLVMVRGTGLAVAHFGADKGVVEGWQSLGIVPWTWPRINSVNKAVNKQRMSICPDCYQHLPLWRQLPAMWPWFPVYPEGRVTTKAGALGACDSSFIYFDF